MLLLLFFYFFSFRGMVERLQMTGPTNKMLKYGVNRERIIAINILPMTKIDHRNYKRQGLKIEPTIHEEKLYRFVK